MNIFEIELRYEIGNIEQIKAFLSSAKQVSKKQDIDVYLDTADHILWQRGIFIRTRNNKKLDIKFNRACLQDASIVRLDYCEEYSFSLPLNEAKLQELNTILIDLDLKSLPCANLTTLQAINALEPLYCIDKVRTSYELDSFTLALDEVAGLGTFLEIELMAKNTDDLERVKKQMQTVLAGLDLQPIGAGYGTLLLRKTDFACYIKGRYASAKDKHLG